MNFAQTFKALSNPIRRSILELLKAGKLSAGDIAGHFDVAGATISHHLNLLKQVMKALEGLIALENFGSPLVQIKTKFMLRVNELNKTGIDFFSE